MRLANRHHRPRRERGVALVWIVITFVVLLGLVGLALDTARVLLTAHELQTAADAGALAGAQWVREDQSQAMLAARTVAAANTAEKVSITLPDNPTNDAGGYVVLGRFDRDTLTFTATTSAPNAVKVIAARSAAQNGRLPLLFGPIFNASASTVQRQAIAMVGGGTGAGLIALNKTAKGALTIAGSVTVNVNGGAMVVDSTDSQGMITNGNPTLQTSEIDVVGGTDNTTASIAAAQGIDLNPGSDYVPDPLAGLSAPNWAAMTNRGTITNSGTTSIQPGYYPGGITQTATGATLNLAPGIYVLDGPGLQITGGNMNAYGVMFYLKGTGVVTLTGNGNVNITGIDPTQYTYPAGTDVYEGMSIFQDSSPTIKPANKSDSKIVGTSNLNLGGTLYFRANHLDLSGTSAGVGNQLIADTLGISGTGVLTINYDGRNNAAGNRVYLVQ